MINIKERVLLYCEYKGFKKELFFKELGFSYANFKGIQKKSALNSDSIDKIISKYSELSLTWLVTGKKPMIKSQGNNILNEPGEVYKINKVSHIPLIPTDAFAGFGGGEVTIKDVDIQEKYVVPEFTNVDFMIRIKGSSMYPKYNSGDVVACKMITDSKFIQWNKVHVISTRMQGVLIKRLRKSEIENCLLAVSDNKSYGSFDIPQDEILNIAIVTGVIRLE